MEPVSLIVAALLAGASAAGKAAAGESAKDAYGKLKGFVAARFAHRQEAQAALVVAERQAVEQGSEQVDTAWRSVLGNELELTGASRDRDILEAARQLVDLLGTTDTGAAAYSVDNRYSHGAVTGQRNTVTQHFGVDAAARVNPTAPPV